ncbi:hypothetical protein C6I20_05765 [Aeromicrobium sp. A1-2]|nr:hypothetical protein C6I20_05765 [Aeromicrobium sp. A1-2]
MAPKVLLASSDELEETTGSLDTSQVQRRSGAFVSGKTVVGYSVDDISGYDVGSGKQLWTAKLDLGGGTVCYVSQPDRAVKTFTVAHGERGYCPNLATIRVSDGKVMAKSDKLNDPEKYEGGSAGGTVNHLFTVKGKDYLVDMNGVVWKMVKGEPEPVARLETRTYFDLYAAPEGDVLIGSRHGDGKRCRVDGYALPSFKKVWTQDTEALFPDVREDCIISASEGNSAWLKQETADKYYMVQVDPATGEVLGRADAAKDSGGQADVGEFDLASASNQFDRALGMPGGDTVFAQVRGMTRYSLESGKVMWDLDLSQIQLDSDEEYPLTTVLPQGVTDDGYLVATVSNDTSAEILAVEAKTGKLVARWGLPEEYRNGFQVEPGMTLFGDGVVLTRNFKMWEFTFADYKDLKEPKGDRYDIGVFTFPEPGKSTPAAVPTAGPAAAETKSIGGLKTPKGSDEDRRAGAFSTGGQVIAYAGNAVTGIDPKSGKELWSTDLDDDAGARVCAAPEPDQKVKTFTIAYRGGAKDDGCNTLLRVNASKGTVMDRVELSKTARTVSRIEVHQGAVLVITGDQKVSRLTDGALVEQAELARRPYYLEHTPQDPSLVISAAPVKDGRDWAIDAYRLPSFERVWSTTASKVLSKVERSSPVTVWRGNGLWISTSYGDSSDPEAQVKDSLVQLDPEDGRVVARTGAVKRDYLANDLGQFALTGAISAAHVTVGFDDGDVVLPQSTGVMRYSLTDEKVRWAVDTKSIEDSMERDRKASTVSQSFDLVDGGKTVLVTLSNGISLEVMTLNASSGKITGRWNVPAKSRNGLQAIPAVTPFAGGVALSHDDYGWDYAFNQTGRKVPSTQRHDVGVFRLVKPAA